MKVDAVCGDGSHKIHEKMEVEGGIYYIVGKFAMVWGPSPMRLTIDTTRLSFFFFVAA